MESKIHTPHTEPSRTSKTSIVQVTTLQAHLELQSMKENPKQEYNQFGSQTDGQSHSLWAGIIPISFGSPLNVSKMSPRSGPPENLILPVAQSDTIGLNEMSHHTKVSDILLSDQSLSIGDSHGINYSNGDFPADGEVHNFVRIAIPSYSTETDSEGKYTAFNITVETDFATIEIKRRYKNFLTLHQELSRNIPKDVLPALPRKKRIGILDPAFVEERRLSLEQYLQELASLREAWGCPRFVEFLDDSHPFLGIQIQVVKLTNEMKQLRQRNAVLHYELQESTAALAASSRSIANLDARLRAIERDGPPSGGNGTRRGQDREAPSLPTFSRGDRFTGLLGPEYQVSPPKRSVESSIRHFAGNVPEFNGQTEDVSLRSGGGSKYPPWARRLDCSVGSGSDSNPQFLSINDSIISAPPGLLVAPSDSEAPSLLRKSVTGAGLSSDVLDVPCNEIPSKLDQLADTILSYILPSFEQLQFRHSVEKYIAKLVRKSLGAQLYPMGIQSLRCFLPDDPISLSIYLCRGLENSWYFRLNEKLCRMSAGGNMSSPVTANSPFPTGSALEGTTDCERDRESSTSLDNVLVASDIDQDIREESATPSAMHHNHVISHVSFMNEHGEYRLQCLAGNTVVDIRANMKIDICFVAYLEEIDRIVGRYHLFKKSISLIRTWWTIEAPAYSKSAVTSEYLPDVSLLIMICAVFNRFSHRIFTPMQALCIFFLEYAAFDWSNFALTVYGPMSVSLPPCDTSSAKIEGGLIPQPMTSKYIDMLAGGAATDGDGADRVFQAQATALETPPRRGSLQVLFGGVPEEEDDKGGSPAESTIEMSSQCMKIYHPLSPSTNTVPESMTHHFVGIMSEALSVGKQKAWEILALWTSSNKAPTDAAKHESLEGAVRNMFQKTVTRFRRGWRPDVVNTRSSVLSDDETSPRNSLSDAHSPFGATTNPQFLQDMKASEEEFAIEIGQDYLEAPLQKMWEQINYCNFLLKAEVTEGTLRTLSQEILQDRGPLPVGEIGKMLQEITGISTLSAYLKDKFGGLKKFLENYPEDFVISTDHPFNPHVFLRRMLSQDEYKSISQGSIPSHLSSKGNKRRTSRKKRLSSGSITSELNMSTVSYGSGSTMISGSSGGIGLSRTSTPPISGGGFNSSPYYVGGHPHSRRQTPPYYSSHQPSVQPVYSSGDMKLTGNRPYHGTAYQSRDQYAPEQSMYGVDGYGEGEMMDSPVRPYSSTGLHPRRRQTIPFPIHRDMDVLPSLPETHSSDVGSPIPSAYGQMGLPDPHAPAFVPSRYA